MPYWESDRFATTASVAAEENFSARLSRPGSMREWRVIWTGKDHGKAARANDERKTAGKNAPETAPAKTGTSVAESVSYRIEALELDVAGGLRVAKTIGIPRTGTYFLAYADGMEIAGSRVAFVGKIDNDGVWSVIEVSMEGRTPTYLAPFLAPNRLWKGRPGNLEGFRVLNRVKWDGDTYSFRKAYVARDGSNIAALSPAFHSMPLTHLAPRAIEEAFATFAPEFLSPTGETLSLTRS